MIYTFFGVQHLQNLEIEITTKCNLKCVSCDRRCGQAPSDEEMTINQIKYFVKETKYLNYSWRQINILGGEPSLHANLAEILEILRSTGAKLTVVSNGYKMPKAIEEKIPSWCSLRNTKKNSKKQESFVPVDITMVEKPGVEEIMSCDHVDRCGLGLTRYGFYACGPGASISRVLGIDIGIKSLSEVSLSRINTQQKILCQYCGWSETRKRHPDISPEEVSPFWEKAYTAYRDHQRRMTLYGH
jgi:hypothetical protein